MVAYVRQRSAAALLLLAACAISVQIAAGLRPVGVLPVPVRQCNSCRQLAMRAQSRAGKHGPALKNVGRAQRTLKRVEQLPDANKVMVSNLDFKIGEIELREACEQFGDVVEVKIIKNRWTGRSRGFGFVVFALPLQATVAIEDMTGMEFNGRAICVKDAFKAGSRAAELAHEAEAGTSDETAAEGK